MSTPLIPRDRYILDNLQDIICLHDPDGTYVWLSDSVEQQLGYAPSDLIGRDPYELIHPDDHQHTRDDAHEPALDGSGTMINRCRFLHADGSWVWIETRTNPLLDASGEVAHLLTSSRCIVDESSERLSMVRAKARFQSLFRAMPQACLFSDLDRRIVLVNDRFTDLFGYDIEDVKGKSSRFLYADEQSFVERGRERYNLRGSTASVQYQQEYRTSSGEKFIGETVGTIICDDAGQALGFLGLIEDVTDRVHTERRLEAAELRFRSMTENSVIGSAILRIDGFEYCNPAMSSIFGLEKDDLLSKSLGDLVHEDDRATVSESLKHWFDDWELNIRSTFRIVHPRGDVRRVRLSGMTTSYEESMALFATFDDITEPARYREDVEAHTEHLRRLHRLQTTPFESLDDRLEAYLEVGCEIFRCDLGIISEIDGGTYTVRSVVGEESGLAPGTCFPLGETYCSSVVEGNCTIVTHRAGTDGGFAGHPAYERFGIETYLGTPLVIDDGIVGTINFSSAKSQDRPYSSFESEFLEQMAESLTRHIELASTMDKLRLERNRAEEATEAKSSFLANMSHEIRTPMNGVIGMTEVLRESPLSPRQREYVETIARSGEHLIRLINDVLDFSKIEAGRLDLDAVPFDLRTIVDDTVDLFSPKATSKGLLMHSSIDPSLDHRLVGDPYRIRQVVANLVSNAVKFTRDGEIEIALTAPERNQSTTRVRFEIRDTGIGMSEQTKQKLFEAFVQGERSTTGQFGGTGLGLAISGRIVRQMGGRIDVQSTPGAGSAFSFDIVLPVAESSDLEAFSDTPSDSLPDRASEPGGEADREPASGWNVLLVEDNRANQLVATSMLEQHGCDVVVAANGRKALDALELAGPDRFHLILMDCRMPVMDGFQATRAIRRLGGRFGSIPIVAMTANATLHDRAACIEAGMDDHFAKPFRRKDFSLLLQSWLRPTDRPADSDEATAEAGVPIDDEVLSKLNEYRTFMGDDGIREIASDFGPSGRRYVRKMRRAYAERRWPDVGATAHALCGLSLNISATRLAGACQKIESASNDGSIEEARTLFDIVEREVDRVDDLLNRHVL